jgi:DNA repair photolyase
MRVTEMLCRTALSSSQLPGLDYSLNPYRGCSHGCAYCYVPNVLRVPRETYNTCISVKTNIVDVLIRDLKKMKPGVIGLSTVTDPYQPVERRYELTRRCLSRIIDTGFSVCIQTKSSLVLRDLDLLSKASKTEVIMTIGTLDDNERLLLEPGASSINDRLNTIKECAEHGIKSSVFLGPVYPSVKIEDLTRIINIFKDYKASSIYIDSFHLKPGVWESIKSRTHGHPIDKLFTIERINNRWYYNKLREEIIRLGRVNSIRIIDAF